MELPLEEKKKLLSKATTLYNKIVGVPIINDIKLSIQPKYYPATSKYVCCGFVYYKNARQKLSLFAENLDVCLADLKHSVDSDKKLYSPYIDVLLDFVYNGDYIYERVKEIDARERKDLDSILN